MSTSSFTVEEGAETSTNSAPSISGLSVSPDPADTGQVVNATVTISDSDGNLDSTLCTFKDADGNVEVDNVSMSGTGSDTYFHEYIPAEEPSNIGTWDVTCYANDTDDATDSSLTTFTVNDGTAPHWRTLQDNVSSLIAKDAIVNISAEWKDDGDGFREALLATNETGSFQNWTGLDGFEDGDYTSSPTWTKSGTGTVSVQSSTVKNGADAVKIYNAELEHDRGPDDRITDEDAFETWVKANKSASVIDYAVSNTQGNVNGSDAVLLRIQPADGTATLKTHDSNGNEIGSGSGLGLVRDFTKWTRIKFTFDTTNDEVNATAYDANDNQIGSAVQSYSGATNYRYVIAQEGSDTGTAAFFDDTSYIPAYNSPQTFNNITGSWTLADFLWSNSTFSGDLGYKIWGKDGAGNWNVTDTGSFAVNADLTISSLSVSPDPADTGQTVNMTMTVTDPDGNLDTVTCSFKDADGNVEVDNTTCQNSGSTYWSTYTVAEEDSNIGDWTGIAHANDTNGVLVTETTTFTVGDVDAPRWQNLQDDSTSTTQPQNTVNISGEFRDNGSGLNEVRLATNESGTWKNWTTQYGSPESFSNVSGVFQLADFNWKNSSFNGYLGYELWVKDASDNWNVTDTGAFLTTFTAAYATQDVTWTNIGGSETRWLNMSIEDYGDMDIQSHGTPPSGSEGVFTNETLRIDDWNVGDFDWMATITDWFGRTGTDPMNFTTSKTNLREDDYSHSLSEQRLNRTATIENRNSLFGMDYEISFADEGTVEVDGTTSGSLDSTVGGNTKVSSTEVWSGDWLTATEATFLEAQNRSKTSNTSVQYLYNQTNLSVTNSQSQFTGVDLSSQCSVDTSADVPSGTSEVTQSCNNYSKQGDWINTTEYDFAPSVGEVTLGVNYLGNRSLELANNNSGINLTDIDTTGAVTEPVGCIQTTNTAVNVTANSTENKTIEMSCDPGTAGNPSISKKLDLGSNNYTQYWYNTTDLNITSNETRQVNVTWKADKNNLDDFIDRTSPPTGYIDGSTTGVEVDVKSSFVYVTFTTDCCTSSPDAGIHSAAIGYQVNESDTTIDTGGDGGSSGGPTQQPDQDLSVLFKPVGSKTSKPIRYDLPFELTSTERFTIENTANQLNTVEIERGEEPFCEYIRVQQSADMRNPQNRTGQQTFGPSGTYNILEAGAGDFGRTQLTLPVKIDMPGEAEFNRIAVNGVANCTFQTQATEGAAGDLVFEVTHTVPFLERLNRWLAEHGLPVLTKPTTICTDVEALLTAPGGNTTGNVTGGADSPACPPDAQQTFPNAPTPFGLVIGLLTSGSLLFALLRTAGIEVLS